MSSSQNWNISKFRILLLLLLLCISSFARLRSRQTKGTSWMGNVEMTKLTRRITVHSYFLDIEEDIELAPAGWRKPPENLHTLEIYGTFNLPVNSVITGILIWDGDNLLKGKLKGKEAARLEYEEVVDRNTKPPPRPRDPILIEKIGASPSGNQYNCAIYPVEWGKSRKIRIRYLVPQRYINNELMIQIPAAMAAEVASYPKITQMISSFGGPDKIVLISNSEKESYSLPTTLNGRYSLNQLRSTFIKIPEQPNSMMFKTGFDRGDWKGNYAMYWGTPPDSLLIKSGLKREIIFLWKWNFWHTFVYNDNESKRISPYGLEAVAQAGKIHNSNIEITNAGDKVGLLLDKGSVGNNKMFPLCGKNSQTFDSLQTFLASITPQNLIGSISGTTPPIRIRVPENERENFFSRGVESFDLSLKLIYSLFSQHDKILKHIVFISAGPAPEMPNLDDFYKNSDDILSDKITISGYGSSPGYPAGYWPGVPMHRIIEKHALLTDGSYTNKFWIPEKKEAYFSATVKNKNKAYTHTLKEIRSMCHQYYRYCHGYFSDTMAVDTMFFSGHSTTQWSEEVVWKAYDKDKNILGSHNFIPPTYTTPNDTFLVKLWAGANNSVSDTSFLSNRGARYGIVDEQYSLLALEHDVVPKEARSALEDEGLPFLSDEEIFLSKPLDENDRNLIISKSSPGGINKFSIIKHGNGSFRIRIPDNEKILSIKIYDLNGKIAFKMDDGLVGSNNEIDFHYKGVLSEGMYTLIVITNINKHIKRFHV